MPVMNLIFFLIGRWELVPRWLARGIALALLLAFCYAVIAFAVFLGASLWFALHGQLGALAPLRSVSVVTGLHRLPDPVKVGNQGFTRRSRFWRSQVLLRSDLTVACSQGHGGVVGVSGGL